LHARAGDRLDRTPYRRAFLFHSSSAGRLAVLSRVAARRVSRMSNELEHPERPPQPLKALTRGGFLGEPAPDHKLPDGPMDPADARLLIEAELFIDGDPEKNLATFVTTWMGKDVTELIGQNLHRNFIDHAEYPQTAEIEQRCIRMLADLFHAPGETMGARTQGSSEAIMLGTLAMKWKWRARQEKAKKDTSKPNLIFGGDVHVVWEKFCRYFDVEPRIVPLQEDKLVIGPEDVEPHIDENTVGVAAVLGTTFTGHADDVVGINELLLQVKEKQGLDIPLHVDGASGGSSGPSFTRTPSGTFGSNRSIRSTPQATSSASSIPGSGGSSSAAGTHCPTTSSSTRTTWASGTRRSRSTSRPARGWSWLSTSTSFASAVRATSS